MIHFEERYMDGVRPGELSAKYSAAGDRILRYYIDFNHSKLNLHKELSATNIDILQNKVDSLLASWHKKYQVYEKKKEIDKGKESAAGLTLDYETRRDKLKSILAHTIAIDDTVDWDNLKDKSAYTIKSFPDKQPDKPANPPLPPKKNPNLIHWIFGQKSRIIGENEARLKEYYEKLKKEDEKYQKRLQNWKNKKKTWEQEQARLKREFEIVKARINDAVDQLKQDWLQGSQEAIVEHGTIVLEASTYDEIVPKDFSIDYDKNSKTLVVEYRLPSPDELPVVKTVRFVAKTGELRETHISAKEKKDLFEEICYQVCLRTIHELFEADTPRNIEKIGFNGCTSYLDKSTGNVVDATILSLLIGREEFLQVNLSQIDAKSCFKRFKGVSAANLVGLAPIAPVMRLEKKDKRFVESKEVILEDEGGTNLASMDWSDFEHLVREIFEKEFSTRGGEVRVTQSSADGGVDAVAFDPDPISGGKIVIQAKRYTKSVGVSAVRDLYGTTMNEGAIKGILVTTSDFGPDAYKFASDKPLTLMSGANLLHLLESHGIKARIDLRAAREELGLKQ